MGVKVVVLMAQLSSTPRWRTWVLRLRAMPPAAWAVATVLVLLSVVAVGGTGTILAHDDAFEVVRARDAGMEEVEEDVDLGALGAAEEPVEPAEPVMIVIDVDGAVVAPGVYELGAAARVRDAIAAAGGLASDADTAALNQAAPLADGQKVHVPRVGEAASAAASGGSAATGTATGDPSELVNINTASADELDTLPGIGPATAAAIIEDREKIGPFTSTEDLMRVSGIGEKKFEQLSTLICV